MPQKIRFLGVLTAVLPLVILSARASASTTDILPNDVSGAMVLLDEVLVGSGQPTDLTEPFVGPLIPYLPIPSWSGMQDINAFNIISWQNNHSHDVHYIMIPEPATISLLALGSLWLTRRRR
ncbi:MAG: PEP-CTERM sorting domain-containing protein [Phycisphaeraceae bacterium]|nr:PEP-CTERM sorting domain-containing protein [Phycisphaeraceae bacterium]